jgi:hypothetical protein
MPKPKNDLDYLRERSIANPKGQEAMDVQRSKVYERSLEKPKVSGAAPRKGNPPMNYMHEDDGK